MLIGIDIAEVSRFEKLGEDFLNKCFNEDEKQLFMSKTKAQRMAANFAAKEAFSKALGTGVRGFSMRDISVLRNDCGKPYFSFSDKLNRIIDSMCIRNIELSISHDGGNAVAVVVMDCEPDNAEKCALKTNVESDEIISLGKVRASIKTRDKNTHKGDYGKIFIVAGSKGLTGAGIMSAKGSLRAGGGLITLGCCESLNSIFEVSLHEVMTLPLADNGASLVKASADNIIEKANKSDVLAFGCGLSDTDDVYEILEKVIANVNVPMVIDADGINALSRNINILKDAKAPVILTPHLMEFSRLSGLEIDMIKSDIKKTAAEFAVKWGVTLVLKSDKTVVAKSDGTVTENILGNPGMATGGSGDVLTGIIASFVGQGIDNAAECGVYVHSLAADLAADDKGEYGMTPTDIIENIPYAVKYICRKD